MSFCNNPSPLKGAILIFLKLGYEPDSPQKLFSDLSLFGKRQIKKKSGSVAKKHDPAQDPQLCRKVVISYVTFSTKSCSAKFYISQE